MKNLDASEAFDLDEHFEHPEDKSNKYERTLLGKRSAKSAEPDDEYSKADFKADAKLARVAEQDAEADYCPYGMDEDFAGVTGRGISEEQRLLEEALMKQLGFEDALLFRALFRSLAPAVSAIREHDTAASNLMRIHNAVMCNHSLPDAKRDELMAHAALEVAQNLHVPQDKIDAVFVPWAAVKSDSRWTVAGQNVPLLLAACMLAELICKQQEMDTRVTTDQQAALRYIFGSRLGLGAHAAGVLTEKHASDTADDSVRAAASKIVRELNKLCATDPARWMHVVFTKFAEFRAVVEPIRPPPKARGEHLPRFSPHEDVRRGQKPPQAQIDKHCYSQVSVGIALPNACAPKAIHNTEWQAEAASQPMQKVLVETFGSEYTTAETRYVLGPLQDANFCQVLRNQAYCEPKPEGIEMALDALLERDRHKPANLANCLDKYKREVGHNPAFGPIPQGAIVYALRSTNYSKFKQAWQRPGWGELCIHGETNSLYNEQYFSSGKTRAGLLVDEPHTTKEIVTLLCEGVRAVEPREWQFVIELPPHKAENYARKVTALLLSKLRRGAVFQNAMQGLQNTLANIADATDEAYNTDTLSVKLDNYGIYTQYHHKLPDWYAMSESESYQKAEYVEKLKTARKALATMQSRDHLVCMLRVSSSSKKGKKGKQPSKGGKARA